MKKLIALSFSFCLISQFLLAQFTGTSPAVLNGWAILTGDLTAGTNGLAYPGTTPSRRINMFRTMTGLPAAGAPLSDYTTGLKITHRWSGTGSSYDLYNWEIAADAGTMYFHHVNTNYSMMVMKKNGNVGIATTGPDATLHVADHNSTDVDAHLEGFTLLDGEQASLLLGAETGASHGEWGIEYNTLAGGLNFWKPYGGTTGSAGSNYHLFIKNDGKVSIGLDPTSSSTFNGDYKLYVGTGILTEKIKVALRSGLEWADYVFARDYSLMPLAEVAAYINENQHLPGVPSEKEVRENGIDVVAMDAKLLEKIEELTLYVIDLEKKYKALETQLNAPKNDAQ